tara:strand:+ start:380 stop:1189 length:810 start_codon:yes stop_codon:yes gene_type:complete
MTNQKENKKDRKSFLMYIDSLSILNKLSDEQAGKLFKAIKHFKETGEIMELDFALEIALDPFLNQFKRDDVSYDSTCEANRIAANLRWERLRAKKKKEKNELMRPNATECDRTESDAKHTDSDNDSDNDNDIKKKKKKEIEKEIEKNFLIFWEKFNHKKSRGIALSSFEKSLKCATFEQIIKGVDGLIAERSGDPKFWKHPSTWLNQQCWLDEYATAQSAKSSQIVELSGEQKKQMAFAKGRADLARKLGVNPDRLTQEQLNNLKENLL